MPIVVRVEPPDGLARYGDIPSTFEVDADPPWIKDYDAIPGNAPADWSASHDVSGWVVLGAYDGDVRVGGAVVDGASVWDIRVHPDHQRRGVGAALWQAAEAAVRAAGHRVVFVETQDINVNAVAFYERMGCELASVDPGAYPELPNETQLLYRKDLAGD